MGAVAELAQRRKALKAQLKEATKNLRNEAYACDFLVHGLVFVLVSIVVLEAHLKARRRRRLVKRAQGLRPEGLVWLLQRSTQQGDQNEQQAGNPDGREGGRGNGQNTQQARNPDGGEGANSGGQSSGD